LAQIAIGRLQSADLGYPQFVHEPALQCAIHALAASPRLRRGTHDVLDAEPGERAADLGHLRAVGRGAGGRRVHRPARAVGVEGPRNAVLLQDHAQGGQDGAETFAALDQLRIEHTRGGVVHRDDQGLPLLGDQREPAMAAAVEVDQLAPAWPRLAAAPWRPRARCFGSRPAFWSAVFTYV